MPTTSERASVNDPSGTVTRRRWPSAVTAWAWMLAPSRVVRSSRSRPAGPGADSSPVGSDGAGGSAPAGAASGTSGTILSTSYRGIPIQPPSFSKRIWSPSST